MEEIVKEKWLKALRSNEYKQGRHCLRQTVENENTFCCLGVLTDLYIKEHPNENWDANDFRSNAASLPSPVASWSGVDYCGRLPGFDPNQSLANMNDNGYSFDSLANIIAKNL